MNIFCRSKKRGFTLGELAIAVLILGILILLCIPIVSRQGQRSEEFSYYMAYKTIEKMSGQIASVPQIRKIEDGTAMNYTPMDSTKIAGKFPSASIYAPAKNFLKSFYNNLASVNNSIFSLLTPSVVAADTEEDDDAAFTIKYDIELFDTDTYDNINNYVRVCVEGYCDNKTSPDYQYCPKTWRQTGGTDDEPIGKWDEPMNRSDFGGCKEVTGEYRVIEKEENGKITYLKENGTEKWFTLEDKFREMWSAVEDFIPIQPFDVEKDGKSVEAGFKSTQITIDRNKDQHTKIFNYSQFKHNDSRTEEENEENAQKAYNYFLRYELYWDYFHEGDTDFLPSNVSGKAQWKTEYNSQRYKQGTKKDLDYTRSEVLCEHALVNRLKEEQCWARGIDAEKVDVNFKEPEKFGNDLAPGSCYITVTQGVKNMVPAEPLSPYTAANVNACTSVQGYVNMVNSHGTNNKGKVNCVCKNNYEQAVNNAKACCQRPAGTGNDKVPYYKTTCKYCRYGSFNEQTGDCCGENQYYNADYVNEDGTHGKCIDTVFGKNEQAFYLINAHDFCEQVADNWNITKKNCNTFSDDNPSVYETLFSNVYRGGILNSINLYKDSTASFKGIDPNIVFANGLKMWILGDRAASIPGLSYTPRVTGNKQNMCIDQKTNIESDCKGTKSYFCSTEKMCYAFNDNNTRLSDARNCCLSSDNSTADITNQIAISGFTVYVDINGDKKGTSTLWDDIYPFYITTRGKVFPAYPLDADKSPQAYTKNGKNTKNTETKTSIYMGGNNPGNLTADIYYYDTNNTRGIRYRKQVASGISYAWASCIAGEANAQTPYCKNLYSESGGAQDNKKGYGSYAGKCVDKDCIISIRRKNKFF